MRASRELRKEEKYHDVTWDEMSHTDTPTYTDGQQLALGDVVWVVQETRMNGGDEYALASNSDRGVSLIRVGVTMVRLVSGEN